MTTRRNAVIIVVAGLLLAACGWLILSTTANAARSATPAPEAPMRTVLLPPLPAPPTAGQLAYEAALAAARPAPAPPMVAPSKDSADPVPTTIPPSVGAPYPAPAPPVTPPPAVPADTPAPPPPAPTPDLVPWCIVTWQGATSQPNPDQPGVSSDGPENGAFDGPCANDPAAAIAMGGPGTTFTLTPEGMGPNEAGVG